jgi:hypothetical protein
LAYQLLPSIATKIKNKKKKKNQCQGEKLKVLEPFTLSLKGMLEYIARFDIMGFDFNIDCN